MEWKEKRKEEVGKIEEKMDRKKGKIEEFMGKGGSGKDKKRKTKKQNLKMPS